MSKTVEEIEKLKRDWEKDPCWDLYDTEGFEEHSEELKIFQENREKARKEKRINEEMKIDEEAEKLGIKGIYRMVLSHKELIIRHQRAIEALLDGDSRTAYNILNGYDE